MQLPALVKFGVTLKRFQAVWSISLKEHMAWGWLEGVGEAERTWACCFHRSEMLLHGTTLSALSPHPSPTGEAPLCPHTQLEAPAGLLPSKHKPSFFYIGRKRWRNCVSPPRSNAGTERWPQKALPYDLPQEPGAWGRQRYRKARDHQSPPVPCLAQHLKAPQKPALPLG